MGKFDPASNVEAAKYDRAYTQSQRYREKSGRHIYADEEKVRKYVETLPSKAVAIDYGCGNGSSALLLSDLGFQLTHLVDFVGLRYAPPEVVNLASRGRAQFHEWTLWGQEVKTLPKCDFTVCTDVMEHIPEEFVDTVMANIRYHLRPEGVSYWRIALWGSETEEQKAKAKSNYGGELHVTVKEPGWWLQKLSVLYDGIDYQVWHNPNKPKRRVLIAFCTPQKANLLPRS